MKPVHSSASGGVVAVSDGTTVVMNAYALNCSWNSLSQSQEIQALVLYYSEQWVP